MIVVKMIAKNKIFQFFLLGGDVGLMYGALFFVLALRYGDLAVFPGPQSWEFLLHFSIIHIFWLGLLYAFDFYELTRFRIVRVLMKNAALFAVFAFAIGAVYFYLNTHSLIAPKTILLADVILFSAFIFLRSLVFGKIFAGAGFEKRIAVAGWCDQMEELARDYLPALNCRVAAVYRPGSLVGFQRLDIFNRAEDFSRAIKGAGVELLVVAAPARDRNQFSGLVAAVGNDLRIKIVGLESFYEETASKTSLALADEVAMAQNFSNNDQKPYIIAKRIFDAALALIALAAVVVIFIPTALAIKIDSRGPVFYVQKRKGKGGKIFNFYKFRTMTATKDQHLIFRANDESQVTRAGKVLRKTHIDEFPQLFNILRGDMSFVGPRPEWDKLAVDYEKNIPLYRYRYLVRPGFTGWAQINYKASASVEEAAEKFEYDLYYIKNRSFWMDISILIKTAQLFFR